MSVWIITITYLIDSVHSVRVNRFEPCQIYNVIPHNIAYDFDIDVTFYKKIAFAHGLPVISSSRVDDMAVVKACKIIEFMLADRRDIRSRLKRKHKKFGVVGGFEVITDIPEYSHLPSWYNQRARGIGGTENVRMTVSSEENLMCEPYDQYKEDIYVHEVAHGLHLVGSDGSFKHSVLSAYRKAKRNKLWQNTYALYDYREYFAEGVQSFFNYEGGHIEAPGPKTGNGVQNNIDTREKLFYYDRRLFNIIHRLFPCANWLPVRCSIVKAIGTPNDYAIEFDNQVDYLHFKQNCKQSEVIELTPGGQLVSTI